MLFQNGTVIYKIRCEAVHVMLLETNVIFRNDRVCVINCGLLSPNQAENM